MVKKLTTSDIIRLYLNDYSRRCYLRELASLLGKPHQTIKPYVESLVKEGILLKYERKGITEYSLNLKSKEIYDRLVIAEKEKLIERLKGETILSILFEKLSPSFGNNTFIVFGSAANKILKGSDIDLLVVGRQDVSKDLEDFEEIYDKKIHALQTGDMRSLTGTFLKEVYKKHLILNNTENVIRLFVGLYEKNKLV